MTVHVQNGIQYWIYCTEVWQTSVQYSTCTGNARCCSGRSSGAGFRLLARPPAASRASSMTSCFWQLSVRTTESRNPTRSCHTPCCSNPAFSATERHNKLNLAMHWWFRVWRHEYRISLPVSLGDGRDDAFVAVVVIFRVVWNVSSRLTSHSNLIHSKL